METLAMKQRNASTSHRKATRRRKKPNVDLYRLRIPLSVPTVRRIAELASWLPGADQFSFERVRCVIDLGQLRGWPGDMIAIVAWSYLDMDAVCLHLARSMHWTPAQVESLTPAALIKFLEDVVSDGPVPGFKFRHEGKLHDLKKTEWLLIECTWGKPAVLVKVAAEHVWQDADADIDTKIRPAVSRLNNRLAEIGVRLRLQVRARKKPEQLVWD